MSHRNLTAILSYYLHELPLSLPPSLTLQNSPAHSYLPASRLSQFLIFASPVLKTFAQATVLAHKMFLTPADIALALTFALLVGGDIFGFFTIARVLASPSALTFFPKVKWLPSNLWGVTSSSRCCNPPWRYLSMSTEPLNQVAA